MTRYMKSGWLTGLCLGLTLVLEGTAMAQTERRVGDGETYATITAALAAANTGDTILVVTNELTENSITISKSVTIAGQGMYDTVVQGATSRSNAAYRIFTVTANGLDITVRDMTLRHGYTADGNNESRGPVFYCTGASTSLFVNCLFAANDTLNRQYARGGAIYLSNTSAGLSVSNCWFLGNRQNGTDAGGGAIAIDRAAWVRMDNSTFEGNSAQQVGGVIWVSAAVGYGAPMEIRNCTFWNNRTTANTTTGGGAFYIGNKTTRIYNATIVSNAAMGTSAVGGLYSGATGLCYLHNSIIAHNAGGTSNGELKCADGGTLVATNGLVFGTSLNATTNGCLVGVSPLADPPADNGGPTPTCALQTGSPCIGAADLATALTFDQRGYARDAAPDLGAFEYGASEKSKSGTLILFL